MGLQRYFSRVSLQALSWCFSRVGTLGRWTCVAGDQRPAYLCWVA